MSFPFLTHIDIPNWVDECNREFYKALDRYDYESILAFKEAHAQQPNFIASMRDAEGNTPLHIAVESLRKTTEIIPPIHKAIIQLLWSVGCSDNTPNSAGVTPMYLIDSLDVGKKAIFDCHMPKLTLRPMDNENTSNPQTTLCTHSDPTMGVTLTCELPNQGFFRRHSEHSSSSQPQSQPIPTTSSQPIPIPRSQPIPASSSQPIPIPRSQSIPISLSQPIPTSLSQPIPTPRSQPIPTSSSQPIPTISSDLSHSGLPTQPTLTDTTSHIPYTRESPSSPSPPLPPPPPPSPSPPPPPVNSGNPEIDTAKENGSEKKAEMRTNSEIERYKQREIDLETSITDLRDAFTQENYITSFMNEVR